MGWVSISIDAIALAQSLLYPRFHTTIAFPHCIVVHNKRTGMVWCLICIHLWCIPRVTPHQPHQAMKYIYIYFHTFESASIIVSSPFTMEMRTNKLPHRHHTTPLFRVVRILTLGSGDCYGHHNANKCLCRPFLYCAPRECWLSLSLHIYVSPVPQRTKRVHSVTRK